jgi:hypothetical protein
VKRLRISENFDCIYFMSGMAIWGHSYLLASRPTPSFRYNGPKISSTAKSKPQIINKISPITHT